LTDVGEPLHAQLLMHVDGSDIEVDSEIAELISLLNQAGIRTIMSCQDDNQGRGTVRRVWVDIYAKAVKQLLEILDEPAELGNMESLSNRMAPELVPDEDYEDGLAFLADRRWHYDFGVARTEGALRPGRRRPVPVYRPGRGRG